LRIGLFFQTIQFYLYLTEKNENYKEVIDKIIKEGFLNFVSDRISTLNILINSSQESPDFPLSYELSKQILV